MFLGISLDQLLADGIYELVPDQETEASDLEVYLVLDEDLNQSSVEPKVVLEGKHRSMTLTWNYATYLSM